jgi:multicomponent Na+:H+ antiporter subunit D
VLLGAMLLTPAGLKGGLLHMVYHAFMKITLFSCVGAIMVKTGRSYVQEVRGMAKKMPFIMGVLAFAALCLVGVPPFIGFQSKWALAVAAVNSGDWLGVASVAVLLVSAVLTAIYMLIPTIGAYAAPLDETGLEKNSYDPGWQMKVPLLILCVAMVILTFVSSPLNDFLNKLV